jgi:signal peptidase I
MVLLGLTAFFSASALYSAFVEDPLGDYYKTHYVRAFTIPSRSMEPRLLVGD